MTEMPRPPAHVEPYVRILGPEVAVEFLLRFGGAELYLPVTQTAAARSPAAAVVGTQAALALGVAQLPKRVPTASPWLARVLFARGLRVGEIAARLHVSDVSVRKWLKSLPSARPADDRQLPLF